MKIEVFHSLINERVINRVFHSLIIEKVINQEKVFKWYLLYFLGDRVMKLNLYSVSDKYINYLSKFDNKKWKKGIAIWDEKMVE